MGTAQVLAVVEAASQACYKRCVTKPGDTISNDQKVRSSHHPTPTPTPPSRRGRPQRCLANCSDRFQEAFGLVAQTYLKFGQSSGGM